MSSPESGGYLILHGWAGSGPEHWQTWLAQSLAARGEFVRYPVLPDYDAPDLGAWLSALEQELALLDRFSLRVVVCHSLAVVLWLHHAQAWHPTPVQRLLFVAPPCPRGCVPEFESFFPGATGCGSPAPLGGGDFTDVHRS